MSTVKSMPFPVAMRDFFGLKPSQDLKGFLFELRQLSEEDRAYFKKGLEANGYEITAA